jgi:uncharacterized protein YrrD
MYILANQLQDLPVMSLQTGQAIAVAERPVINPFDLEVMALQCVIGRMRRGRGVILMRDIRQFSSDCVIIDSFDEIEDPDEIVRLRNVAERNFNPVGKLVVNESGQRLGKVEDYTINLKTFMLQKLYVHQSLMKSILFNSLVIDRTQIIEVTAKQFTVRDASVTEPSLTPQAVPHGTK